MNFCLHTSDTEVYCPSGRFLHVFKGTTQKGSPLSPSIPLHPYPGGCAASRSYRELGCLVEFAVGVLLHGLLIPVLQVPARKDTSAVGADKGTRDTTHIGVPGCGGYS